MDTAASTDMILFLANHAEATADVLLVLDDASTVTGYPSRASLGGGHTLVLTPHGASAGAGEDVDVAPDHVVYARIVLRDGTLRTFGVPDDEVENALTESLAEAERLDPNGPELVRVLKTLGAVSHAFGKHDEASRHYRHALRAMLRAGVREREQGDVWIALARVHQAGALGGALDCATQAIAAYTHSLGSEHPITKRARRLAGSFTA